MERHGWEDTVPDPDPLPPPFSRDSGTPTGRDWVKGRAWVVINLIQKIFKKVATDLVIGG